MREHCVILVSGATDNITVRVYGHVHSSLRILVKNNNSVFDDSGLILASINLTCSEVLNISHVTHTPSGIK